MLEAHEVDPALAAQAEAGLGASLDDVPYDRDSVEEIEAALPPPPPLPDLSLPPIVVADEKQAEAIARARVLSLRAPAVAASHGGGGGDAHTYNTAVCLVHGFGLPIESALPLLWNWNRAVSRPGRKTRFGESSNVPTLGKGTDRGDGCPSPRCRRITKKVILILITATFRQNSFIVPRQRLTECWPSTRWNR